MLRAARKISVRTALEHLIRRRRLVGRNEWVALPELGIDRINAKVDTGAATSAIHCDDVCVFRRDGADWVRFQVVLGTGSKRHVEECVAAVRDRRRVKNSSGVGEQRYVIETPLTLGDQTWPVELTLATRENLRFRVILGRQALRPRKLLVHPNRRHILGDPRPGPDVTG